MILVVDFFRYWLHRAAHESSTLWRLHAVHHSVEQLYWLNTARFHPIEKALQMSLDSLPFVLMGVDARVLSLYYLAYGQRVLPALQHPASLRRAELLVRSARNAPVAPLASGAGIERQLRHTVIIWDLLFGVVSAKAREVGLGCGPEFRVVLDDDARHSAGSVRCCDG